MKCEVEIKPEITENEIVILNYEDNNFIVKLIEFNNILTNMSRFILLHGVKPDGENSCEWKIIPFTRAGASIRSAYNELSRYWEEFEYDGTLF